MDVTGSIAVTNGPEHTLTQMRIANKAALLKAVQHWHKNIMPGHFERSAEKKYGYQLRAGQDQPDPVLQKWANDKVARMHPNWSYWHWKRKKLHTINPLVKTGASREAAIRTVKLSARMRPGGIIRASAAMSLPSYFYMYKMKKDGTQGVDKYKELVAVTPDEVDILLQIVNQEIFKSLESQPTKRTTRKV